VYVPYAQQTPAGDPWVLVRTAVPPDGLITPLRREVNALDPVTLFVSSAILVGSAILGCLIPARRATKVNPLVALRYE
jgi:ABC-type lipoprotein release transport system permease subunit